MASDDHEDCPWPPQTVAASLMTPAGACALKELGALPGPQPVQAQIKHGFTLTGAPLCT